MIELSKTPLATRWLAQFSEDDQVLAAKLIDALTLVRYDELMDRVRALTLKLADQSHGCVGLYAEREVRKRLGIPNRLFAEKRIGGRQRAYGSGPKPVQPTRTINPQIGSEGLISHLITELCREDKQKLISHPGPDQFRSEKVHTFVLLTDFIGSGARVTNYLNAAWRVASVRSWWSYGLLRFAVVAYAATERGRKRVEHHACKPSVRFDISCPTIESEFDSNTARSIRSLCVTYDPLDHDEKASLGFHGTGALIAFAHGCPNNAPRILHQRGRKWVPLFPARVTAQTRLAFGERRDQGALQARLARLREGRLSRGGWLRKTHMEGRLMILLLAALRRGPRFDEAVARKTTLTVTEVQQLIQCATELGWLDSDRHVTEQGFQQLAHARSLRQPRSTLLQEAREPYYPTSLRAPMESI